MKTVWLRTSNIIKRVTKISSDRKSSSKGNIGKMNDDCTAY